MKKLFYGLFATLILSQGWASSLPAEVGIIEDNSLDYKYITVTVFPGTVPTAIWSIVGGTNLTYEKTAGLDYEGIAPSETNILIKAGDQPNQTLAECYGGGLYINQFNYVNGVYIPPFNGIDSNAMTCLTKVAFWEQINYMTHQITINDGTTESKNL